MKAVTGKELIEVDDLRVGMFVHLGMSWMSHPFALGSFKISNQEQVATIRSLGVERVRWSPTQSDALPPLEPGGRTGPAPLDDVTQPQPQPEHEHEHEHEHDGTAPAPALARTGTLTSTDAFTSPLPLESPEAVGRSAHKRALTGQRAALQLCERQFAEAAHDCKHLTDLVPSQPAQARAQASPRRRGPRPSNSRRRWSTRCSVSRNCASGCCRMPRATRQGCTR